MLRSNQDDWICDFTIVTDAPTTRSIDRPAIDKPAIDKPPIQGPTPERRLDRAVSIGHRAEYLAVRSLFFFSRLVGVDAASAIAGRFTRTVGPLLRRLSNRARDNLKQAYPDWSKAEIETTVRGVWDNLGRTAIEFPHLREFVSSDGNRRIEIVNAERLNPIRSGRRPVIFVSGHFANWEVLSIALRAEGIDYGLVYRTANNPLVDELIVNLRSEFMSEIQIPKGRAGMRELVETIKEGRSLAMLLDQKLNSGISVPFMGRPAMTANSAAKLALKFDLPIVPAAIRRTRGANFRLFVRDAIEFKPTGDAADDVFNLTLKINQALEREIKAQPDQWLWLHRRWPDEVI